MRPSLDDELTAIERQYRTGPQQQGACAGLLADVQQRRDRASLHEKRYGWTQAIRRVHAEARKRVCYR